MDSVERFEGVEFAAWANRDALVSEEEFLLGRYLDPALPTLEAGTGGGCILAMLQKRGFVDLWGFDNAPRMIETAKRRLPSRARQLSVQDARKLDFADCAFGQAIYLQQVLCFIQDGAARAAALREAHRVLAPHGTALFSFLCWEDRLHSLPYRTFVSYLGLLRKASGKARPAQLLPWAKSGGRPNPSALLDRGPHVYWYRIDEAARALRAAGFEIVAAGSSAQIAAGGLLDRPEQLRADNVAGGLYFVCSKPLAA